MPKLRKANGGKTPQQGPNTESADNVGDVLDTWMKSKALLRPDDQLNLPESILDVEHPRVLSITNPLLPENVVEFSHKFGKFVLAPHPPPILVMYLSESTILHQDSEEAKLQRQGLVAIPAGDAVEAVRGALAGALGGGGATDKQGQEQGSEGEEQDGEGEVEEEGDEGEAEGGEGEEDVEGGDQPPPQSENTSIQGPDQSKEMILAPRSKKIINQFNYCERAALIITNPARALATQTVPPPRRQLAKQVYQFTIFDQYAEDYKRAQAEKAMEKDRKEKGMSVVQISMLQQPSQPFLTFYTSKPQRKRGHEMSTVSRRMIAAVKTLERMVNQNLFDDIAQDYRYWEDPSDDYREEKGSLLPLWKFVNEKAKKNSVTDICWSPCYYDMFAVSYGTFDFLRSISGGAVCLFTTKNPSFPEFHCQTASPVMSVDVHPAYPHLLAVGKMDGNVAVYNVRLPTKEPSFHSKGIRDKHASMVWQVKWAPNMPDGEINFYSVSGDGFVFNWILTSRELARVVILCLILDSPPVPGPNGMTIQLTGCGTAFAFHPTTPRTFLVGTEEGQIHKCCTEYASMFLQTYRAHYMPVHRISYNKYYPSLFISCSADWTIKIWEDGRSQPLFVFDVSSPVGDVEWAPYSSTVFAASSNDGKVHVFDISINKYKSICSQSIVSKRRNKLTRLAFNTKLPILVAGDDRGTVTSLKLSPNLRKKVKPPKKGPQISPEEMEVVKLEKLLELVREPTVLEMPQGEAKI